MDVAPVGQELARARRDGRKLRDYPGPVPDMEAAQAIQDAMSAAMGAPVVGWKVGLTSAKAQEICGWNAPLAGPVHAGEVHESGVRLAMAEGDLGILEAEIGFTLGHDLPPREAAYERAEVAAAIVTVHPLFEWVNKRLPGRLRENAGWILADGVMCRGLIRGAGQRFDPAMDLRAQTVEVRAGGAVVSEGRGANAMGDPLEVMVWLANALGARGRGLAAGEIVATGLICDIVQAAPGTRYLARFATLGEVALDVA